MTQEHTLVDRREEELERAGVSNYTANIVKRMAPKDRQKLEDSSGRNSNKKQNPPFQQTCHTF